MKPLAPLVLWAVVACASAPVSIDTPQSTLESRDWSIEAYFDGAEFTPSEAVFRQAGFVAFNSGALSGSPGCGALIGDYAIDGDNLSISADVFLTGSCLYRDGREPMNPWPASLRVVAALNMVSTLRRLSPDEFALQDATGREQIRLVARQ